MQDSQLVRSPSSSSFILITEIVGGGLTKADLKSGQTVAMIGAGGGLGHLGIQFAKALGLYVIAIDARDSGLQLAEQCGADTVVDARLGKEKVVEEVKKVTQNLGAEATLNFSDHETSAATAAAVTRNHGVMIQMAQPENVSVPFMELIFRDIRIHGSLTGEVPRLKWPHQIELLTRYRFEKGLSEYARDCVQAYNKGTDECV